MAACPYSRYITSSLQGYASGTHRGIHPVCIATPCECMHRGMRRGSMHRSRVALVSSGVLGQAGGSPGVFRRRSGTWRASLRLARSAWSNGVRQGRLSIARSRSECHLKGTHRDMHRGMRWVYAMGVMHRGMHRQAACTQIELKSFWRAATRPFK